MILAVTLSSSLPRYLVTWSRLEPLASPPTTSACISRPPRPSPTHLSISCHELTIMATTDSPSHVDTLFSSLLEQSRKLRQETDNDGLETVQLGLNELERRAKDLKKKTKDGQQTDARAYVFLP